MHGQMVFMICYPAGIFYDVWLELPSSLKHLPSPGLEFHRCLTGRPVLIWLPHGEIQAVDDDVLHRLRAQQVQEVQLDAANADFWLLTEVQQAELAVCNSELPHHKWSHAFADIKGVDQSSSVPWKL